MEIIKLLKDYSKTPMEEKYGVLLHNKLESSICVEKIKNRNFMIKYPRPLNDFLITTTQLPCNNVRRVV